MKNLDNIRNLEKGNELRNQIRRSLNKSPIGELSQRIPFEMRPAEDQQVILKTLEAFEVWVAEVIVVRALSDRRRIRELSQTVISALTIDEYLEPAIDDAERALKELLSLAASDLHSQAIARAIQQDTAFIIMPFARHAYLQDTYNTIKRVCTVHGFNAFRADDLYDGIAIERIHESIACAEIVIGDLTLSRENVIYEVGVANGKEKNPILFRRKGTKLPFNLAAYNVPEYRSYTELESLLTNRLKSLSRN